MTNINNFKIDYEHLENFNVEDLANKNIKKIINKKQIENKTNYITQEFIQKAPIPNKNHNCQGR